MTGEYMSGYQDGTTVAKGVAESLLAQANSEKATLIRRIDELCQENEQLRQQNAKLDELLPENGRWFSFDVVRSLNDERDQLAAENKELRTLCEDMLDYSRDAGFDNMVEWFRDRIDALGLVG